MLTGMAQSNLLMGLKAKYAGVRGELIATEERIETIKAAYAGLPELEARIEQLQQNLQHLVPVIRMVEPDWDEETVAPRKPFTRRIPVKTGDCARLTLDILREATEPMSAREVALEVLRRSGIAEPDQLAREQTTNAVNASLRQHRDRLVQADDHWPMRWTILRPRVAKEKCQDS